MPREHEPQTKWRKTRSLRCGVRAANPRRKRGHVRIRRNNVNGKAVRGIAPRCSRNNGRVGENCVVEWRACRVRRRREAHLAARSTQLAACSTQRAAAARSTQLAAAAHNARHATRSGSSQWQHAARSGSSQRAAAVRSTQLAARNAQRGSSARCADFCCVIGTHGARQTHCRRRDNANGKAVRAITRALFVE